MHTVIKGTKTINEYKKKKEMMEMRATECFRKHQVACTSWQDGSPIKAWYDGEGLFCVEYESGRWWQYNDKNEVRERTVNQAIISDITYKKRHGR